MDPEHLRRPSDAERAASELAASDLLIELIERDANAEVCLKLRVPTQRFGNSIILVVQNGWERPKQMSRENRTLGIGQVKRQLFDFSDGGHDLECSER